jgi:hypothetical protein
MTVSRIIYGLMLLFIAAAAVLCFGPWYDTPATLVLNSLFKLLGLVIAFITAFMAFSRMEAGDPQRRPWALMAVGLLLYAGGQSVLAVYQLFMDVRIPFPSVGDPLFVISYPLIISALFRFCVISIRSGLPLGRPLVFWSPALLVVVIFAAGCYPLMAPIVGSGDPAAEIALNIFYPVASFVALAPCLVMLRTGLKFRGGRLLLVWLPMTLGFAAVLISDILFAYLVTVKIAWVEHLVDFLYISGYALIPIGTLSQSNLLK